MQYYIMVIIATVLLAVDFVLQKLYQKSQGTGRDAGLVFNAGIGFVTAVLFLILNKGQIHYSLYAAGMALGMSVCLLGYTLLGFRILGIGNLSFYTMFLMTGGMVVPYIWGVLFLNEPLTGWRVVGLLCIVVAIIVSNYSKEKLSRNMILLCGGVFLLNGGSSVVSKMCQTPDQFGVVEPMEFVFWTGVARCILCVVLLFVTKRTKADTERKILKWQMVLAIVGGSAVVSGCSYLLQLMGAAHLPATVLYPIISGGSIVFSAIAGMLCFKEKPSVFQWVGIVLCFMGICCFL